MVTLSDEKRALRDQMLEKREDRFVTLRAMSSDLIVRHIRQWPVFREAKTIMAYSPIDSEVDIWPLVRFAQKSDKTVLLPVVQGKNIVAVPVTNRSFYRVGKFGIREPIGDPHPPGDIDLVLVPGLAFDEYGYRLGYGGGYYDRFLPGLGAVFCGIAYQLQIIPAIPHDKMDIPMHWIAMERGLLEVRKV